MRCNLKAAGLSIVLIGAGALALSACTTTPNTYVALGDSYVSGPLIPTGQPDHPGCFRSDHDYPSLAAPHTGVPALRDVSCAGATAADMFVAQQVSPPPANPPQLDAVRADARVVTLGIGGNDIGFTGIVASCIRATPQSTPCRAGYVHGTGDDISARIADTAPKIALILRVIHADAPLAKVFVVGYPDILPDDGVPCFSSNAPFTATDIAFLRDKEKELNAVLGWQAVAFGAGYVDTYQPSIGHDLCRPPATRWVEGLAPTSPAAPVHPNEAGMRATAGIVAAQIRAALA